MRRYFPSHRHGGSRFCISLLAFASLVRETVSKPTSFNFLGLLIMHLSIVCPTYPTCGKDGGMVGDMQRKYGPRGGANVICTNEAFRVQR